MQVVQRASQAPPPPAPKEEEEEAAPPAPPAEQQRLPDVVDSLAVVVTRKEVLQGSMMSAQLEALTDLKL
jgi:hypothetical protein